MNENEIAMFEQLKAEVEREQAMRMSAETRATQMSGYQAGKEPNIIEYQLDVSPTLDRIYHLLSGHILIRDPNGNEHWEEPEDDRLKILTEYGVKQIMNLLSQYISPDMLLSNLEEEQIYNITKVFGEELADLLYCRYEYFYYHPSPEDLFDKYKNVVRDYGLNISDLELYQQCLKWSREELQMKFRHYPIHVHSITHKVFVNLMRAWKGKERDSLRKQYNVHQNLNSMDGNYPMPMKKQGFFSRMMR